jgi:hypothetical protein
MASWHEEGQFLMAEKSLKLSSILKPAITTYKSAKVALSLHET